MDANGLKKQTLPFFCKDKAVNSIFKSPPSIFFKIKAMDMMFNGLPIDCTVTDTAGSGVCSLIRENADALQSDGPDLYRFSLFGAVSNFK